MKFAAESEQLENRSETGVPRDGFRKVVRLAVGCSKHQDLLETEMAQFLLMLNDDLVELAIGIPSPVLVARS